MSERYSFPVRYESADMRAAVNAFTLRALIHDRPLRTAVPLALIALSAAGLAYLGEGENAAMLLVGALALLAILIAGGWRMQQRMMRERLEKARGHISSARLLDEGVIIDSGATAPLLPWKSIRAIWPTDRVWLLVTVTNHFIALPIERAPKEALDFMQAQVTQTKQAA